MPHRSPDPRRFSADGHGQHHIVFTKFNGLQVGNAALVAPFPLLCRYGHHRGFARRIVIGNLLRDTARRPRPDNDQATTVIEGRGSVIHRTGNRL